MRIDSHQHFWHFSAQEQPWMREEMSALKRSFLPEDLLPLLKTIGFQGSVAIQARQMLKETEWLLELADQHDFICGVVGWVDLRAPDVEAQLSHYAGHFKLKGVRHVIHDEPDDDFMLREDFQNGISKLKSFGLTYDLLIFAHHLPNAIRLVERFPEQPFVVDHLAKPLIKTGVIASWQENIRRIAQFPNVYCKLSGLAFEADWRNWSPKDFYPYLDVVLEAFGHQRLMIGSNWPVELMAGSYATVMDIVMEYIKPLPAQAQACILGETCAAFYHL